MKRWDMEHTREAGLTEFNLEKLNENELQQQARHGLPLIIPWQRKVVRLGTCLHSNRVAIDDPWSKVTPFILSDLYITRKILQAEYGTTSTFRSTKTSRTCETGDHLTLGFGMGVGLPFLASVKVKGTYDNDVQENEDSDKTSIRASGRSRTIELERQPRLAKEAIIEIKCGNGYPGLCELYGDYYLAGYRLGGDTGLMLSSSGHSRKEVDTYGITATVDVLFIDCSETWTKDFETFRSGRSLKLLGFDTLNGKNCKNASAAGDDAKRLENWLQGIPTSNADSLISNAEEIITRSQCLKERVGEVLEAHGYSDGDALSFDQCESLVEAGVVVELLLLPLSRLQDVARWTTERNIV